MENLEDKIGSLTEEILELKSILKKAKDKEFLYLDLLQNIKESLNVLFIREEENKRFNLGETFDFRESLLNLQSAIKEFENTYKINL